MFLAWNVSTAPSPIEGKVVTLVSERSLRIHTEFTSEGDNAEITPGGCLCSMEHIELFLW